MAKSDKIDEIIKALRGKQAATKACPACGSEKGFTLVDGYFKQDYITIENQSRNAFGGLKMPRRGSLHYIVVVCDNCGYLRQHATKILTNTDKPKKDLTSDK